MADRIVQLIDKNNDNIFPVTTVDGPTITVTSTDPGAGSSLAANHFVAVTGSGSATVGSADLASNSVTTAKIADNAVTTAKIADDAVTADKIDFSSLSILNGTIPQATSTSMNLTAGDWLVFGYVTCTTSGSSTPSLKLRKGSTMIAETYCGNEGATVWENLCIFRKITVASGENWNFYADVSANASTRSQWLAIKVSN